MEGFLLRLKRVLGALLVLCILAATVPEFDVAAMAASPYYVTVDLTNQIVTVYDSDNVSESGIVRQMICSTGKSGTPTPKGTFTLPKKSRSSERSKWYYFSKYRCYAQWATRITGGILFHSVIVNRSTGKPTRASVNALGSKASHGCVRLKIDDAYWIAKNVPAGTKVKIYNGSKNKTLHKLILKKTFFRDEQTYDSYLGRAPRDPNLLGKGSRGDNVRTLQARLQALGFYDYAVDGVFGSGTESCVKRFQSAIGAKAVGAIRIDGEEWEKLLSDDSPTSTDTTWKSGMKGPALKVLQQALKDCKVYDGEITGVFDDATAAAVRKYQSYFGYTVNGAASPSMQQNAISRGNSLRKQFGDEEYEIVVSSRPVLMGKVKAKTLYMRKKKSTRSKAVKKLKKNKRVRVLSKGKWCKVKYGSKTGYVLKRYLKFYYTSETVVNYVRVPEPEPVPSEETPETATEQPVENAADQPIVAADQQPAADTAEQQPASTEQQPAAETADQQPVSTEQQPAAETADQQPAADTAAGQQPAAGYAVALHDGVNLYAQPDASGDPVATMSDATTLPALAVEDGWVKVTCQGQTLYVAAADVDMIDHLPGESGAEQVQPGAVQEPSEQVSSGQASPEQPSSEQPSGQGDIQAAGLVVEDPADPVQENGTGVPLDASAEGNE